MKMKKKGYAMGGMKKGYAMGGMKKKMKAGGGVKKFQAGKKVGMDPMGLMSPKKQMTAAEKAKMMAKEKTGTGRNRSAIAPKIKSSPSKPPMSPAVRMPTPMNPGTGADDMKRPMPMAKKGGSIKKMKAGGMTKKMKAGGGVAKKGKAKGGKSKVRGAGIAQRGVRKAQMR